MYNEADTHEVPVRPSPETYAMQTPPAMVGNGFLEQGEPSDEQFEGLSPLMANLATGFDEQRSPKHYATSPRLREGIIRNESEMVLDELAGGVYCKSPVGIASYNLSRAVMSPTAAPSACWFRVKFVRHYMIGPLLGEGTFGSVRLALDMRSGASVAVKKLRRKQLRKVRGGEDALAREISILGVLDHRHTLKMLDFFEDHVKHKVFLVVPFALGSLQQLVDCAVRTEKRLGVDMVQSFTRQLLEGLAYLHGMAICHKDIKMQNLMLMPDGMMKISDFGTAEQLPSSSSLVTGSSGTPAYQSPEIAHGEYSYCAFKSDVWSAGVCVYAMKALRMPFEGNSLWVLYEAIASKEVDVTDVADGVAGLETLLRDMLLKDPAKRPTAAELLEYDWVAQAESPPLRCASPFSPTHMGRSVALSPRILPTRPLTSTDASSTSASFSAATASASAVAVLGSPVGLEASPPPDDPDFNPTTPPPLGLNQGGLRNRRDLSSLQIDWNSGRRFSDTAVDSPKSPSTEPWDILLDTAARRHKAFARAIKSYLANESSTPEGVDPGDLAEYSWQAQQFGAAVQCGRIPTLMSPTSAHHMKLTSFSPASSPCGDPPRMSPANLPSAPITPPHELPSAPITPSNLHSDPPTPTPTHEHRVPVPQCGAINASPPPTPPASMPLDHESNSTPTETETACLINQKAQQESTCCSCCATM